MLACHAPPLGAGTPRRVSSWLLGHFAVAAGNRRERRPTLAEGEAILARGAVSHNHLSILLDRLNRDGEAAELRAQAEAIRQRREQPPSPPLDRRQPPATVRFWPQWES